MLTEQEVNRVFSWLPYRDDWPVDRNQRNDNIKAYYGVLVKQISQNELFDTYYSEDGGLGNYLEFLCYPSGHSKYEGFAVMVCISLCAPIAAYGQTTVIKSENLIVWGGLFSPDNVNVVTDDGLFEIVMELRNILERHNLFLVDKDFVSRPLPEEVAENLKFENHNEGEQYLHGLFQKID